MQAQATGRLGPKVTSEGGKLAEEEAILTPTPNPVTPTLSPSHQAHLFAGADFEDWKAFTGCLNSYGLKDYATQVRWRSIGKALQLKGTPAGNDYVFITAQVDGPISGKTISFYIKGTSGSPFL